MYASRAGEGCADPCELRGRLIWSTQGLEGRKGQRGVGCPVRNESCPARAAAPAEACLRPCGREALSGAEQVGGRWCRERR